MVGIFLCGSLRGVARFPFPPASQGSISKRVAFGALVSPTYLRAPSFYSQPSTPIVSSQSSSPDPSSRRRADLCAVALLAPSLPPLPSLFRDTVQPCARLKLAHRARGLQLQVTLPGTASSHPTHRISRHLPDCLLLHLSRLPAGRQPRASRNFA